MHLGLGPNERLGFLVVGLDEGIDVLPELLDGNEGRTLQRASLQDRKTRFRPIRRLWMQLMI